MSSKHEKVARREFRRGYWLGVMVTVLASLAFFPNGLNPQQQTN